MRLIIKHCILKSWKDFPYIYIYISLKNGEIGRYGSQISDHAPLFQAVLNDHYIVLALQHITYASQRIRNKNYAAYKQLQTPEC